MIKIRRSDDRGKGEYGWLSARYTFSFANYDDPNYRGFRKLLVMNEDRIAPGQGFAPHSHRDMEIVTYIIDGAIQHEDSTGSKAVIKKGEIQRMTAGSGIRHSEFNALRDRTTHSLQIWIEPSEKGLPPSHETLAYDEKLTDATSLALMVANGSEGGVAHINQDVKIYAGHLPAGVQQRIDLDSGRHGWLQLVKGQLNINDFTLGPGDGAAISEESTLNLEAVKTSEFLFFDLC